MRRESCVKTRGSSCRPCTSFTFHRPAIAAASTCRSLIPGGQDTQLRVNISIVPMTAIPAHADCLIACVALRLHLEQPANQPDHPESVPINLLPKVEGTPLYNPSDSYQRR